MSRFNEYLEANWTKDIRKHIRAGYESEYEANPTHTLSISQTINRVQKAIDDTRKQLANNPKFKTDDPEDNEDNNQYLDQLQKKLDEIRNTDIPRGANVKDGQNIIRHLHNRLGRLWSSVNYVLSQYDV